MALLRIIEVGNVETRCKPGDRVGSIRRSGRKVLDHRIPSIPPAEKVNLTATSAAEGKCPARCRIVNRFATDRAGR
jgi:hypothetical protein